MLIAFDDDVQYFVFADGLGSVRAQFFDKLDKESGVYCVGQKRSLICLCTFLKSYSGLFCNHRQTQVKIEQHSDFLLRKGLMNEEDNNKTILGTY